MKMCYACPCFYEGDHDCPVAKKMIEDPVDLKAPYLTAAAIPTRTGPDQHVP